jgi:hypothetical protein
MILCSGVSDGGAFPLVFIMVLWWLYLVFSWGYISRHYSIHTGIHSWRGKLDIVATTIELDGFFRQ